MKYDHQKIEQKWQQFWVDQKSFATPTSSDKPYYCLDMFPYPSGAGLHVGHPKGYIATDIVSRMRRAQGYDVLHPMGWDSFGLPAENYAIKTGVHPKQTTNQAIDRFRVQLKQLGLSYDWDREVSTSDPAYYKWTQWIFLQLYKKGLAYKKEAAVNWCPQDQTVLANEQVINGKCDRCGTQTVQRQLAQWFLKITDYADDLLDDLDRLDWPESIKAMQRNWIGRSEGAQISFTLKAVERKIEIFTTRPETLHGVTYLVLAPEHPMIHELYTSESESEVKSYLEQAQAKTELDRQMQSPQKTGVFSGSFAIHPITGEELPIWIADYVLSSYGTGAVMAVPAHDSRDWDFAKTHQLSVKQVINSDVTDQAFTGHGLLINSGSWNGVSSTDTKAILQTIDDLGIGMGSKQYRLRDWLVSRQRYWGPPIPIIYCEQCGTQPVAEADLPVLLPDDVDFRPTGESPLTRSETFQRVNCPKCGGSARRESDTLDTFVDSSWYFFRYLDPTNANAFASSEHIHQWMPVNLYVGGAEHAVLHLLYARFITKALDDILSLGLREPFSALKNQGLIIAEDGRKMSKSFNNVINPDEIVVEYGADTLRLYEMFMGPFEDSAPWSTRSMIGVRRWLDRVWNLKDLVSDKVDASILEKQEREVAALIRFVTDHIDQFRFNTVVSQMMITTNSWITDGVVDRKLFGMFVQLLAPFAPHISEELWEILGQGGAGISRVSWPELAVLDVPTTQTVIVQVSGKMRGKIQVTGNMSEDQMIDLARALPAVSQLIESRELNVIVVPNKVVNFVVLNQSSLE